MGVDLRIGRDADSYERFLVYPAETDAKEILNHKAIAKYSFRGTGGANPVYGEDEFGNIVRTFAKNDTIITTDNIKVKVGDYIYNTYGEELNVVLSWEEEEIPTSLQFSRRPITRRIIKVKGNLSGE
jgi:hypothetical protein